MHDCFREVSRENEIDRREYQACTSHEQQKNGGMAIYEE